LPAPTAGARATRALSVVAVAAAAFLLSGCASVGIDEVLQDTNASTSQFTDGKLALGRTDEQRKARAALTDDLLSRPLSENDAVQVALANSPAVQALLAQGWADIAAANQEGRLPNPVFKFERLRLVDELELGRLLSVGLVDLILLPQRMALSKSQSERVRVQLASTVVDQVTQVRQAWVRAVAARQSLQYAVQVNEAAQAGAELARRMQQVGNFSKLQQARQQVFHADATTQLASAQHATGAAREELVRLLGLDDAQAARLQLPERLPDLPKAPRDASDVAGAAKDQRLDVRLSRAQLDVAGKSQGLNLLSTFIDVDAGARHDTFFVHGARANRDGYELDIRLPLFDWGNAQRDAMNAQALAAAHRYDATVRGATSQLREGYSAYRTAYDIARHYRDEIVPLRKTMAEENMLRYNGMLIGVFELLAETREQIASVMAAINAQQQFWLADAALAASLVGKPVSPSTH
jgi:hypothetical protein